MSWSIKQIGTREAVKNQVSGDVGLPPAVRDCILSCLGEEKTAPNGIRVEGYGHTYTGGESYRSNIGKLEIEPFELLTENEAPK